MESAGIVRLLLNMEVRIGTSVAALSLGNAAGFVSGGLLYRIRY